MPGDVFIGQAMKAIATLAFGVELLRDGEMVGGRAVISVEGRIEAGNLRELWKAIEKRANGRQVGRLMQWSERNLAGKLCGQIGINLNPTVIPPPSVHDAVADRDQIEILRL